MHVTAFEQSHLARLTALINQQIVGVPPGWTLDEARVRLALANVDRLWSGHYPDDSATRTETLCALEGDALQAALSWGVYESEVYGKIGIVYWLACAPGAGEPLERLLREAIDGARTAGCGRKSACRRAVTGC